MAPQNFLLLYRRWIVGFAIGFLFLISFAWVWFDWERFLYTPLVPPDTHVDYIFPSGASTRVLAHDLQTLGLLQRPHYLIALAYFKGDATHLRAGEYRFMPGTTPGQLLQQIANGQVLKRHITFIEGWTFSQIMDLLNNNPLIVHRLIGVPRVMIMAKLGLPGINPEGLFFPSTYKYTAGMSDTTILLEAYREMQNKLNDAWAHRDKSVPYTDSYEALITASIIEKEAEIPRDRPQISGVIIRRLAKGMLLQMDSTVIYALGKDYHPPLTKEDLKIDSPYNTYIYPGLPPTPIAMPGLSCIDAAVHPDGGNYLYFVSRGDGSHQFSATYAEQQAAIAKYLRR